MVPLTTARSQRAALRAPGSGPDPARPPPNASTGVPARAALPHAPHPLHPAHPEPRCSDLPASSKSWGGMGWSGGLG
jgi:hypothetical protein